jgi:hypothetical protein
MLQGFIILIILQGLHPASRMKPFSSLLQGFQASRVHLIRLHHLSSLKALQRASFAFLLLQE